MNQRFPHIFDWKVLWTAHTRPRQEIIIIMTWYKGADVGRRCLAWLQRNFRWWSGSWSGTFISGTGLIGQGTGKKRTGNLNFGCLTLKRGSCFGQCFGLVCVVSHAIWWCQVVTRWSPWSLGAARVFPGGYRAQNECVRKLRKRWFLCPGIKRGGF